MSVSLKIKAWPKQVIYLTFICYDFSLIAVYLLLHCLKDFWTLILIKRGSYEIRWILANKNEQNSVISLETEETVVTVMQTGISVHSWHKAGENSLHKHTALYLLVLKYIRNEKAQPFKRLKSWAIELEVNSSLSMYLKLGLSLSVWF